MDQLLIHPFFPYFAAAFATALFLLLLRRRRSGPPLPPGPTGLPVLGSLLSLDPELHTHFASLAAKHGPIFSIRLGGKLGVVVSSPATAREVLRDHDAVFANRDVPATARVLAYGGADIVWNPNGPVWRMLRKVTVREVLSPAGLDAVYELRRREVRAAVRRIRSAAESGRPVDVGAQMFMAVMNVITSTLWGSGGGIVADHGAGDGDGEVGREFRDVVAVMTELLGSPNVSDFFPAVARFDLQGMSRKMEVQAKRFDAVFDAIIKQRKGGGAAGDSSPAPAPAKDFLEHMLRLEEEDRSSNSKTPFTMTHVKGLLMDMVVGGTETTSNTMEWAIAEMLRRPETLRAAQREIDAVVGDSGVVEEIHIGKLHYLAAVIKEVLRLHPALPLLVPHCPSSDAVVAGFAVPEGSRIFVNVWAIHRDPSIWDRPSEFMPERFLAGGGAGGGDYSGNEFSYFPFGSGRRICAGIAMAERMTGYLLATMLHSFDWELAPGEKHDLEEKFGIVLKKARPLMAVPSPRLRGGEHLYQ